MQSSTVHASTQHGVGIGLHLLFLPATSAMRIPRLARREIMDVVLQAATETSCIYMESCVREDHVHILVEATREEAVARFIHTCMEGIIGVVSSYYPSFTLSDGVHVTLLPAWHLEIMASFLRDQDRYHEFRTVNQEIREVFQPQELEPQERNEATFH